MYSIFRLEKEGLSGGVTFQYDNVLTGGRNSRAQVIAIVVVVVVILVMLMCFGYFYLRIKERKRRKASLRKNCNANETHSLLFSRLIEKH